ncbi:MAG: 4Fe-4S binding protein [Bacteroidales bacterium]|nr:4Fe-4S binding protein [Bacteroidales bacterium]
MSQVKKTERKTVVYTTKAKCRDCYRCVRVCPVNAIKMESGQAQVVTENCIACGTCIIECPQHAKTYTTDYGKVLQMLEGNQTLIVSLAPSFAGYYTEWEQKRLPSALRSIGFHFIAETAAAAWDSAIASANYIKENKKQHHICTACPAVVNYINIYAPQYAPLLVPVASPMIAHAKMLKQEHPKAKFVFIGPCVAKKDELLQPENEGLVDAVLTFDELNQLMKLKGVMLDSVEESKFDQEAKGFARLFPLEGGLLKTGNIPTDMLNSRVVAVSGFEEVHEILLSLKKDAPEKVVIEPLFCRHGCINGPVANREENVFNKRARVLAYAEKNPGKRGDEEALNASLLEVTYHTKPHVQKQYSEAEIRIVLEATGKHHPEDELNCTACGYSTCREKAIAVLDGLAEVDMCMPFIRRTTEQRFEMLIKHDPNGIVSMNNHLEIIHMNDAFKRMFSCSDSVLGKSISYLMDPDFFEKAVTSGQTMLRETMTFPNYNLTAHIIVYPIPDQDQYVGIFMDITDFNQNRERLSDIKSETMQKAQELLDHQITMAQDLARFLGEHTAKEEFLLHRLIDLTKQ